MHGDAAFAGQGIWAETLNFAGLKGYSVGGAIQVIVNNLIGFTTNPRNCIRRVSRPTWPSASRFHLPREC